MIVVEANDYATMAGRPKADAENGEEFRHTEGTIEQLRTATKFTGCRAPIEPMRR